MPFWNRTYARDILLSVLSGCLLAIALVNASVIDPPSDTARWLLNWKFTHWVFDYGDGFIKRGLIGEIFRRIGLELTYDSFLLYSMLLNAVVFVALAFVFSRPFKHASIRAACEERSRNPSRDREGADVASVPPWRTSDPSRDREGADSAGCRTLGMSYHTPARAGAWLFFLWAMTHPATLAHFMYDLGRFDGLLLLLALAAMGVVAHVAMLPAAVLVLGLLGIAILIHEAALLMYVPLVLVYWFYLTTSRETRGRIAMSAKRLTVPLGICAGLVFLSYLAAAHGSLPAHAYEEHLAELRSEYGQVIQGNSLRVLYRGSTAENIRHTLSAGFSMRRLLHHVAMALVLAPSALLFWRIAQPILFDKQRRAETFFLLAAFSPLGLYLLGHDHFRWWALSLTNLLIALSFLALHDRAFGHHLCKVMQDNRKLAYCVLMLNILVGPLAVVSSFPQPLFRHLF